MTDKEELVALLNKWGVTYNEVDTPNSIEVWGGYSGFYTAFVFDADGKFVRMGAWE
jgi:hypothetical protein